MAFYNPFARRESHGQYPLTAYRVLAPLSWALVVVVGIYYSIHEPSDISNGWTIWSQLGRQFTAFSVNVTVVEIYWVVLLLSQIFYLFQLFNKDTAIVALAGNSAAHFILNNLFVVAWILLWTRNHFWPAEIIVIAHIINQHLLFWRIRNLPPISHIAVVAGPYAWTLITLFWTGAAAVRSHNLASNIAANIFLWIIFLIGSIHIFLAVDDLLGYSLSLLTFGLAVAQTSRKSHLHLQWIFAWVIFGVFLLDSLYVTSAKYVGRNVLFRSPREPESSDAERAPLLNDATAPASTS
ncbi:hypothetical protein AN7033.2 [Aspergillus nidulans FGSC A4]|uniref:DUF1774-domain-containing protein n=1 Tax=Emericella nidulans (strain FGSC A4 / ATCC 38163 / CBS 112.46 / NRRL 194 / M139) TaxID=227321 RepID=Q5AXE7_EMENI|nr:hypothetical protein [Aspergillus nidulans FGSC A4]EAA61679.1 hypothetical protein AN7033.2 [Aspergillus nidulans FGSC A4]CBF79219.1 TPA: conserved hypothetical protein [Aspergillus nidulans FGSC A4]|eukprot:XP_664637.1 hypothetical protein AN7033.2 [Aspergillus nidulans FGSC A4]